ncbi:MAG: hypothetical protein NC820_03065 [Candidatus Omnitrophica bacterium]|nr:hypothetical protein [Candidatus Omnitrophota bacterium]
MISIIKKRLKDISFKGIIWHNFWLKVISLIVAIITWFYVNGELTKGIKV